MSHENDQSLSSALEGCDLGDAELAGQVPPPQEIGIEDLLSEAGKDGPSVPATSIPAVSSLA